MPTYVMNGIKYRDGNFDGSPVTYSLIPDYTKSYVLSLIRNIPVPQHPVYIAPFPRPEAEVINIVDIPNFNNIIQEVPIAGNIFQYNNANDINEQLVTFGETKTQLVRGYHEVGLPLPTVKDLKRKNRRQGYVYNNGANVIVNSNYPHKQPCCRDLFDYIEDVTKAKAERRARSLLRRHLTKDEYKEYKTHGYFFVTSNKGNLFKLETGQLPKQYLNRNDNGPYLIHCIYLGESHGEYPAADQLLAWKFILQNDEDHLLKIANSTPGPTHPNWINLEEGVDDLIQLIQNLNDLPEGITLPLPINQDIVIDEFEKYVLDWVKDLGVPPTDNDLIIARHVQDSVGVSEIPPWHWDEVHEELIGLYSEWPRLVMPSEY